MMMLKECSVKKGKVTNLTGIRIHGGASEDNSSGCVVYATQRNPNGTVINSTRDNHNLTQLIYNDNIKLITITHND
jgi:hypothetical protein